MILCQSPLLNLKETYSMPGVAIKHILRPDLRRIRVFLAIPLSIYFVLFALGHLFSGPYVYLGAIPGTFLFIFFFPFTLNSSLFQAIGIDIFYSDSMIAKICMLSGFALVFVWWYIFSCTAVFTYDYMKKRN